MQRKALSPDTSLFSRELKINFKPIKSLVLGQTLAKFPSFPALYSDRFYSLEAESPTICSELEFYK